MRPSASIATVVFLVFVTPIEPVYSGELLVPSEYSTIQTAIVAAVDGDTILVEAGSYVENIAFLGKALHVKSADGPDLTIIDGSGNTLDASNGTVVSFVDGEGLDSILEGFTITGGSGHACDLSPYTFPEYVCGGGIACIESSPTIRGNIISGNGMEGTLAITSRGAGVFCFNSAALIEDNVIVDNFIMELGDGAGVCYYCRGSVEGVTSTLRSNVIDGNYADNNGGGVFMYRCSVVMEDNLIENNEASRGGGLRSMSSTGTRVVGNDFVGNSADWGGGAYVEGWDAVVEGNIFDGNSSPFGAGLLLSSEEAVVKGNRFVSNMGRRGGAITCYGDSGCTIGGNVFVENDAEMEGGAIYAKASSGVGVVGNTFVGNTAEEGSIYFATTPPHIPTMTDFRNNILWGGFDWFSIGEYVTLTVEYNDVEGGYEGTGNIEDDPLFENPDEFDLRLAEGSPCIDAGDPNGPIDLDGSVADMGAFPRMLLLPFKRGDVDASGDVSGLEDAVALLRYAFAGGKAPRCFDAADVDDDGSVAALSDGVYLLAWQFLGGSPPPAPGADACGLEETADTTPCDESPGCSDS